MCDLCLEPMSGFEIIPAVPPPEAPPYYESTMVLHLWALLPVLAYGIRCLCSIYSKVSPELAVVNEYIAALIPVVKQAILPTDFIHKKPDYPLPLCLAARPRR